MNTLIFFKGFDSTRMICEMTPKKFANVIRVVLRNYMRTDRQTGKPGGNYALYAFI